jgi:hypothetical protein
LVTGWYGMAIGVGAVLDYRGKALVLKCGSRNTYLEVCGSRSRNLVQVVFDCRGKALVWKCVAVGAFVWKCGSRNVCLEFIGILKFHILSYFPFYIFLFLSA